MEPVKKVNRPVDESLQKELLSALRLRTSKLKYLGIRQKEFAKYLGVAEATLSAWTNGHTPIPRQILRILEALDKSEERGEDLSLYQWRDTKAILTKIKK